MGLGATRDFALYHYVLSRARWNSRAIAHMLLTMILDRFLPTGPVVIGIDGTIERRWSRKIAAHALPDMAGNFDAVSARPGHERNLMSPYFTAHRSDRIAEY